MRDIAENSTRQSALTRYTAKGSPLQKEKREEKRDNLQSKCALTFPLYSISSATYIVKSNTFHHPQKGFHHQEEMVMIS